MADIQSQLDESIEYIRSLDDAAPSVGIILGSGLSSLSDELTETVSIDGASIPNYPIATAPGHQGRLLLGQLAGSSVCLLDGRLHRYEGHGFDAIVYPVRLMVALGIRTLVVSNASGGVNDDYRPGDLVVLDDHINLMWGSPLRGPNPDQLGPRFPDMSSPYDAELSNLAIRAAVEEKLRVHRGVYLALTGPAYETPAEYRMARTLGADVVGMSTVPEVIAARHAGIQVLGLSVVSNVFADDPAGTSGDDVIATVAQVAPAVAQVVKSVLAVRQHS